MTDWLEWVLAALERGETEEDRADWEDGGPLWMARRAGEAREDGEGGGTEKNAWSTAGFAVKRAGRLTAGEGGKASSGFEESVEAETLRSEAPGDWGGWVFSPMPGDYAPLYAARTSDGVGRGTTALQSALPGDAGEERPLGENIRGPTWEFYEEIRRARTAAAYAEGQREAAPAPVSAGAGDGRAGAGAAELDRLFQRDARRYDGGFGLY